MISLITTGRDDDYGNGFLERLITSIENNAGYLEKHNIEYEYIICEWNPSKNMLFENERFLKIINKYNIVELVIKNTVSEKERLNNKIFYEYFAKNSGVRNAKYDNLLILNSDIIIPEESFNELIKISKSGLSDDKFYRLKYREEIDNDLNFINVQSVYYPQNTDSVICGFCSGDFLLVKKKSFIDKGNGYDETNINHRKISQTGMDGEILWNMYNSGMRINLIEFKYQHINHDKPNQRDGHYNTNGYENKPNWGFIDYEKKIVSDKLIEIG